MGKRWTEPREERERASVGEAEGGEIERLQGRTTDTQMWRYRLSDTEATFIRADQQASAASVPFLGRMTVQVEALTLPHADQEGRGWKE